MTNKTDLQLPARFFFGVLLFHSLFFLEWNLGPPPAIFREPAGFFSWIPYFNLNPTEHFIVFVTFLALLMAAFWRPRNSILMLLLLSLALYYFSFSQIMGNPRHQYQPVVLFLGGFLLISLERKTVPNAAWIHSLQILWCLPYFAAGLSKLRNSGLDFVTQTDFPRLIETTRFWFFESQHSPSWKEALDQVPVIYAWLAGTLFFAQLTCPLVFFIKRLQLPYVLYFASFHVLSFLLLGFDFLPWLATFGIWLPHLKSTSESADLNPLAIGATRHP